MHLIKDEPFCSKTTNVTMTAEVTRSAREWADDMGLKWATVRQRRYRGWPWSEALKPELRRTTASERGR
ncbi:MULTISPECIES: hypothetical protein [Pseudomonas]|uniref:hypothetical protein n=1 Tax=Pseudomonas TaxID=286 RepID=UPI0008E4ABE6|nr:MULTISPECIES: hypothetical protein [Pseudomonas]SFU11640.1 hypothetical protein SAMN05216264_112117 [Pseudomonas marincola]